MTYRTKLSAVLFLAGFAGVLSFLLVDLSALLPALRRPTGLNSITVDTKIPEPDSAHIAASNSVFGVIASYLCWRTGLEAAITAHMLVHVGIVSAIYFGI